MVDWGDEGTLPCKLWGFVDLTALPNDFGVNHGDVDLCSGCFAVAECAELSHNADEESVMSSIFVPVAKQVGGFTHGLVTHLKFYLIDVEAFHGKVAVTPDLGGQSNDCLMIKPRSRWREDFISWLESGDENEDVSDGSDDEGEQIQANYAWAAENSDTDTECET